MKQLLYVTFLLTLYTTGYTATPSNPLICSVDVSVAEDPKPPVNEQVRIMQMKKFVEMTPAGYERLSGKKMHVLQKIAFKLSQKRMKNMLRSYRYGNVSVLQKISWFLRGMLFGPFAVLLAYIFTTEDNRELIKWAWFGFAAQGLLFGIVTLVVLL